MFERKLKIQEWLTKRKLNRNRDKTGQQVRESSAIYLVTVAFLKMFVLCFFGLIIFFPFAFMILVAIMPDLQANKLNAEFIIIPESVNFNNFTRAFDSSYWQSLLLTFLNVLISIVSKIFVVMLAGYAFSLKKWWGKEFLWGVFIALLVLPEVALMTGQYKVALLLEQNIPGVDFRKTFVGVLAIIALPFMASIFNALMYRNAFSSIPKRIKEVSTVDGASGATYLFKIAMPMVRPITLTIVILTALAAWNSYLWPALIAGGDYKIMSVWLFGVGRLELDGIDRIMQNVKMAGAIIAIFPMFLFYFIFRKRIMNAVSNQGSAIKG
ncbi:ABC-type maltose transport systems, permease component [Mycoplasmopsis californica]|uniref:Carbohydrate ABC transporter permease n=1 Tax=Mycoplasmopsis equigenitalium TaxID=114883 RepID=A0ABY5J3Z2_9BACT|nr:carbohydrate ABC transporter permease [Mycoplasmopsis equigenitalium]UUD36862.1 carbohydrate ABC transporter permease [Mycoplasmopsis equigenitalium]VEU69843.1 ABC-type maltose transport systems, permease component [Mycoplasmopsis californica]